MAKVTIERPTAGGKPLSVRQTEERLAYLFIAPWIIGFTIFTAGAMLFSLYISMNDTDLLSTSEFVGLGNFAKTFQEKLFYKSLGVTFTYTIMVVPIGTLVALAIAMLLNQKVEPIALWRTIYYLPAVVSGVAVALLWGWVLNPEFGLVNQGLRMIGIQGPRWFASEEWAIPGVVLIAVWGTGTNMLLYLAGLQAVPTELQEAARIDGANGWQVFRNVTLPLITPTIFFNVVTNIIASFQVFTTAYVLTQGGPNNATLTMVLYLYRESFQLFHFGYASAFAWMLFAIILIFTMVLLRSSAFLVHYEGGLRR